MNDAKRLTSKVTSTQVKQSVRLTREGFHFAFMLAFVMIGAVLRDVNLLVLLGGALMAMLVLQWRLCSRTLQELNISRTVPSRLVAHQSFQIRLEITNQRRWLGAWQLILEDQVAQLSRRSHPLHGVHRIALAVSHLPARSNTTLMFNCRCQRRGKYHFGRLELSTRFPFGLMQAKKHLPLVEDHIVHPPTGKILAPWRELLQFKNFGAKRQRVQSGATDGEFFGLRTYRPGDSLRWIHWRSSARKNEIMVRQFERQETTQACILLDLWIEDAQMLQQDLMSDSEKQVEHAIEFAVSLIQWLVTSSQASVSIALCGDKTLTALKIQSRPQVLGLMDELSLIQASDKPDLVPAIESLVQPLKSSPHLIVISTRAQSWNEPLHPEESISGSPSSNAILQRISLRWLNVAAGDLDRYFVQAKPG